jgi:hypothetical protein
MGCDLRHRPRRASSAHPTYWVVALQVPASSVAIPRYRQTRAPSGPTSYLVVALQAPAPSGTTPCYRPKLAAWGTTSVVALQAPAASAPGAHHQTQASLGTTPRHHQTQGLLRQAEIAAEDRTPATLF